MGVSGLLVTGLLLLHNQQNKLIICPVGKDYHLHTGVQLIVFQSVVV